MCLEDFPTHLIPLYNYFYTNYIEGQIGTRFPINLWNVSVMNFENKPRTNNAIEVWHSIF
jgi:hypothetical protein